MEKSRKGGKSKKRMGRAKRIGNVRKGRDRVKKEGSEQGKDGERKVSRRE
jgi:hypothetical protein